MKKLNFLQTGSEFVKFSDFNKFMGEKEIYFSNFNGFDDDCLFGDSYKVEFFPEILTPVILLDTNSDISMYIQQMTDPIIFFDFNFVGGKLLQKMSPKVRQNMPPICLFSFSCSSGVFLFKQTTSKHNIQLKKFMSKESGRKFVGFKIAKFIGLLRSFYGQDLEMNIEDFDQTRMSKDSISNDIYQISIKLVGQPKYVYNDKIKSTNWFKEKLMMKQVLFSAFQSFSLSLCYDKFFCETENEKTTKDQPKKQPKQVNQTEEDFENLQIQTDRFIPNPRIRPVYSYSEIFCSKGEIHFTSESDFDGYEQRNWLINDCYNIEFFPGCLSPVILLDANTNITKYLQMMASDPIIFIDFEYVMPYKRAPPICLYQFCCKYGVFLFKQTRMNFNGQLKNFLIKSSGHKFFAKGIYGDMIRLREMFGDDFEIDIEDVEETRLNPYNESCNFDAMVIKYAGEPKAHFKDKTVSRSNWNKVKLSMKQVIYSAFDVVSLFHCYPNFKPYRCNFYAFNDENTDFDPKKMFNDYIISVNGKLKNPEIDKLWNENSQLVAEMLKLNLPLLFAVVDMSMFVTNAKKLSCKLCPKSRFKYFSKLVNHFKTNHSNVDLRKYNSNDLKSLFMLYLFKSGRIVVSNNWCVLCSKIFDSKQEFENHCWNDHCNLLYEFVKTNNDTKYRGDDDDQ